MIARGTDERRPEDAANAPTLLECPAEHIADGLPLSEPIVDDASLIDIVTRQLELRLDERNNIGLRRDGSLHAGQHLLKADERDVNGGEVSRTREGRQIADVGALEHRYTRIAAECISELSIANVDCVHVQRPAAKQHVGEATGRCTDIEADSAVDGNRPGVEGGGQFLTAAGHIWSRTADAEFRIAVDLHAGLGIAFAVAVNATGHDQGAGGWQVWGCASSYQEVVDANSTGCRERRPA
ncbi:MAG: hypothetical protein OXN86_05850 [Chloroflexota bacterium]|nr:hypothetical protein [Chloroflexota bacterium]